MALTLTAKLAASKSGTSVDNATSTFSLGDMTGDEMHQTIYVSTGTAFVSVPTTVGLGSIDTAADHWVLLRNMEDTSGTWVASFDGTDDHINIGLSEVCGPMKIDGGKNLRIKASASGIRLEIVACEP